PKQQPVTRLDPWRSKEYHDRNSRTDQHIITVTDPEDRDGENEVAKRAAAHARHPREKEKADNIEFLAGSGQRTGGRENGDACVVEGGNEVHACAGTPCQDAGRPVEATRLLSSSAIDGCPRSQGPCYRPAGATLNRAPYASFAGSPTDSSATWSGLTGASCLGPPLEPPAMAGRRTRSPIE